MSMAERYSEDHPHNNQMWILNWLQDNKSKDNDEKVVGLIKCTFCVFKIILVYLGELLINP